MYFCKKLLNKDNFFESLRQLKKEILKDNSNLKMSNKRIKKTTYEKRKTAYFIYHNPC